METTSNTSTEKPVNPGEFMAKAYVEARVQLSNGWPDDAVDFYLRSAERTARMIARLPRPQQVSA